MQNHSTPQYYRQSKSTLFLQAVSEEIYDGIFTVINPFSGFRVGADCALCMQHATPVR